MDAYQYDALGARIVETQFSKLVLGDLPPTLDCLDKNLQPACAEFIRRLNIWSIFKARILKMGGHD